MAATRVLIADDESLIRIDLKETLTAMGYQVVGEASDGQTAVRLARDLQPDVVIMDIKMPELDGIEAARILTGERIAPVLLLSAFSQTDLIQRANQAGVVNYLIKPWRETELQPAIEVALQRYKEFRAKEKEAEQLTQKLEDQKVINKAKGVLMDKHNLSEAEAYKRLQKLSMDTRKSMREIADAIMLAHQVEH